MPFDDTSIKTADPVLETLEAMREGVERAWCRGEWEGKYGRKCLVGWLGVSACSVEVEDATAELLNRQLPPTFYPESSARDRLAAFNDLYGKHHVLALVFQAVAARMLTNGGE